ncbi:MAG: hypothetical protein R3D27_06015 [Hyphomicrobiaceae bacterium]
MAVQHTLVSVVTDPARAGQPHQSAESTTPAISGDGRYVAFESSATNLVDGDTNGFRDIFVKDMQTGVITLVSADAAGGQANGNNNNAEISADGRYVVFESLATQFGGVAAGTARLVDIWRKDLQTGALELVSGGSPPVFGANSTLAISSDGRFVAFIADGGLLPAPGGTNTFVFDIYRKDMLTGDLIRVAKDVNPPGTGGGQPNDQSYYVSISADGSRISYTSFARDLVASDTNGTWDVFVWDAATDTSTLISTDNSGVQGAGASYESQISADGTKVVFISDANNLITGDTGQRDVFVKNLTTGETIRVSTAADGTPGNGASEVAVISPDGRYVAFLSRATNLVPTGEPDGGAQDIFVKNIETGEIVMVTVSADGVSSGIVNTPIAMAFTTHGSKLVFNFGSSSEEIVAGDSNNARDIILTDLFAPDGSTDIFTTGDDTVDLNTFDLSLFTVAQATDALAGDDIVTLSSSQNVGIPFFGGAGDDSITGTASGDFVNGGDDNDTITGGAGSDTLSGDDGNDRLFAGSGTIIITGAPTGTDALDGGDGDDELFADGNDGDLLDGGIGIDHLVGRAGNDTLSGGADNDIIEDTAFAGSGEVVDIDAGSGNDVVTLIRNFVTGTTFTSGSVDGGNGIDALVISGGLTFLAPLNLSNFERLVTSGNQIVAKAAQFDAFDRISFGEATGLSSGVNLVIEAVDPLGAPADVELDLSDELNLDGPRPALISGSHDNETIFSGDGNDTINGGDGNDRIAGGGGSDTLDGGNGARDIVDYTLLSNNVTVTLNGSTLVTVTVAGGQNDQIRNFESVFGGSGDDNLTGDGLANILVGNDGTDTLVGMAGNDVLDGGAGSDTLIGGDNDDALRFDSDDLLSGGNGNDYAVVGDQSGPGVAMAFTQAMSIETVLGGAGGDDFDGSGMSGRITLYGRGGADSLTGGIGGDIIFGGIDSDVDTLDGGNGNDNLYFSTGDVVLGGAGNDNAIADDAAGAGVTLVLGAGHGVETVLGGAGNDTLDASASTTSVHLHARGGTDVLIGGAANDVLYFDGAGDQLTGGGGTDIASAVDPGNLGVSVTILAGVEVVYGAGGADVIDASATTAANLDGRLAVFGGAGADDITGGAGNDILFGGADADTLDGGDGNDVLYFTSGDTLIGGAGHDYGVAEGAAGASVALGAASGMEALYGNVGGDALDGAAMTTRVTLDGRGGDDTIIGGSASDLLFGGSGNDTITGGAGGDFFYFANGFGADTITDFEDGSDRINLTAITGLDNFGQLTIAQDGADVLISVTATPADTIRVEGALVAQFSSADFYI